jgi:cytochrome c biogenesis protein CcmG, thiol:disulfide interchange protein DsbE
MSTTDPTPAPPRLPPSRRAPIIAGIVGVAVLALVVLFVVSPKGDERDEVSSTLLGELAPELTGTTLDGSSFDIDSYRGQWVLVNFFAEWCPPCVQEHPELVTLSERNEGQLQLVSVAFDESESTVREFFAAQGGTWPVLASDTGRIAIDYGVKGLPESFLIAPDGTVFAKFEGGITADRLEQFIADATAAPGGSTTTEGHGS